MLRTSSYFLISVNFRNLTRIRPIQNKFYKSYFVSNTQTRRQTNTPSGYMASSEMENIVEDPDLVSMKHLNVGERGGRGSRGRGARGGRGSGERGRGGREKGGGPAGKTDVQVSRALSQLLRHKAEEAGIALDNEGYAPVDKVVRLPFLLQPTSRVYITANIPISQLQWNRLKGLHATFEDIKIAVSDNAKQRFSMKPNPRLATPDLSSTTPSDWVIRANQGHTIVMSSAALNTPITLAAGNVPSTVVHGTFFAFWPAILASGGLSRMDRNHIHFSTGLPEDKAGVVSGMRGDAELLIYVDIKKSLEDGGVWWLSENGVVLTEGDEKGMLDAKYWTRVVGRQNVVGVLWEDGKVVNELPEKLRGRKPPRGKEASRINRKAVTKSGKPETKDLEEGENVLSEP
jgi:2'-phosphotransferase